MQERDNILRILKETREAMTREDAVTIKNLSNQTINTASLTQDPDNVAVAVIVYSLGKVLERHQYQEYAGWDKFYSSNAYTTYFHWDTNVVATQVTTFTGKSNGSIIFQFSVRSPIPSIPLLGFPPPIGITLPSLPSIPSSPSLSIPDGISFTAPSLPGLPLPSSPILGFPPPIGITLPSLPSVPTIPLPQLPPLPNPTIETSVSIE